MVMGKVVAFDERRGLGTVRADDGTEYPFHRLRVGLEDRLLHVAASTYVLKLDCPNQRAWVEDGSGTEVMD